MSGTDSRQSWIRWLYLALAIVGAGSTWSYNLLAIRELGDAFTPQAFLRVGFEGSPLLGSLASDFWVGSLASLVWMVSEGLRLRMARIWIYVVLTLGIAWAFALPLFLFMRERHLAKQAGALSLPGSSQPVGRVGVARG